MTEEVVGDSGEVTLVDDQGVATYVQPEVFGGRLMVALQSELGPVERFAADHPRIKRLVAKSAAVAQAVDQAKARAANAGVPTTSAAAAGTADLIEQLKAAGLVLTQAPATEAAPAG